ncbi:MAG TPA: DUF922 domain-containing protein [Dyella sp.]|nr:DUF922 domain-containing protein [Dyella sp.]
MLRKVAFMVLMACCTGAHAEDAAGSLTVTTYDVHGATADAIADDMARSGPLDHGHRVDGYTRWRIQTSYAWRFDPRECRLTRFDATLGIAMTLPQWVPTGHPSASLRRRWERFSAALRTHEDGHAAIGRDARQQILDRARALGPESDCKALVQRVDDLVADVMKSHRQMDVDYDARTNHGETQGAVFP